MKAFVARTAAVEVLADTNTFLVGLAEDEAGQDGTFDSPEGFAFQRTSSSLPHGAFLRRPSWQTAGWLAFPTGRMCPFHFPHEPGHDPQNFSEVNPL
jgi:hypothetical protein